MGNEWWKPKNLLAAAIQSWVLNIIGGTALALLAALSTSLYGPSGQWTDAQRLAFVIGLTLFAFVVGVLVVAIAQSFLPSMRRSVAGERSQAHSNGDGDPSAGGAVLPQILHGLTVMLDEQSKHLDRVDADTQRQRAIAAEKNAASLVRRFEEAERRAQDSESSARAALGAEAALLSELEAAKAEHAEQTAKAVEKIVHLTMNERASEQSVAWAKRAIETVRGNLGRQVEVVEYRFQFQELNEDVSANFAIAIKLRSRCILPLRVGESAAGRLGFHQRRMSKDPEISGAHLSLSEDQWIFVRQHLEGDAQAVRADWTAGTITVDGGGVRVSLRCDDPSGGEMIEGWLRLPEAMVWPTPQSTPST